MKLVMISNGEPVENRAKVTEHGLSFPVVLTTGLGNLAVLRHFRYFAAYLIDQKGVIAHDVAVGVEPILHLRRPSRSSASAGIWPGFGRDSTESGWCRQPDSQFIRPGEVFDGCIP